MKHHQTLYDSLHHKLMTLEEFKALIQQAEQRLKPRTDAARDALELTQKPLIKLFTPDAQATWLLAELDPEEPTLAFGLCDLGLGFPELGNVSIQELVELRGPFGLPVEKDRSFRATQSLWAYAREARLHQRIVA